MLAARRTGLRVRLRYWFDNSLARGAVALIGWLGLASALLVAAAAVTVMLFDIPAGDAGDLNGIEAAWQALLRTLDPGTMAPDTGWPLRLVMLSVTLGGIFVVSALIGVVTTSMDARIADLRKGRSIVLESGHTVVIGWSDKVFTLLAQLALAEANVRRSRVVILADRDKVGMEDEIRARLGGSLGRMRVICRSGDPMVPDDLVIANVAAARSIVILAPDGADPDGFVLRCLMALHRGKVRPRGCNHIVATVSDSTAAEAIALIGDQDVRRLNADDLIARVVAQTCRQSGLSVVYTELLGFDGDEIYFQPEPLLEGVSYGEALLAYDDSAVIGLREPSGRILLNPPAQTVIAEGAEIIAISRDDDTVVVAPEPVPFDPGAVVIGEPPRPAAECTLILGWNHRGAAIIRCLDTAVAPGSWVDVVRWDGGGEHDDAFASDLANVTVAWRAGEPSDRRFLEALDLGGFDHVILLADVDAVDTAARDEADTRTLVTLLNLRDLAARHGHRYSIVTELIDTRNRELAEASVADDFIVSDELISLILAQVSQNAALNDVLTELFDSAGCEVYLRPAGQYVLVGQPVCFATVVESARRRGETAIGYRCARDATDETANYGVVVNPRKSAERVWTTDDRVIVIAES